MYTWLTQTEGQILLWIQEQLRGSLDNLFICYTQLGDGGMLWILLSLLLLGHPRIRKIGYLSLLALLLGFIMNNLLLKPWIDRLRPWMDIPMLLPLVDYPHFHSFPSGHTCAAFAASIVWAKKLPWKQLKLTVLLLAALMGFSRLYVGVHYPSDVLARALIGSLSSWLSIRWD